MQADVVDLTLRRKLSTLFNIHPGEGRLVLEVLAYAILLYAAHVLAQTAAFSLFLAEFDVQSLPYTYLGISGAATAVSFIYLKLRERFSLSPMLIGVLGLLGLRSLRWGSRAMGW